MTNGVTYIQEKVKLLCYLILVSVSQVRGNNILLSLFPSVQPEALLGSEGLLKCQGPGVYSSFAVCLPHRSLIVSKRTHFSCTFVLAVCLNVAKNLKLWPSHLPRLHLKKKKTITESVPPLRAPQRSRAKPHLSSCGQSAGRNCFIPLFFFILPLLVRLGLFTALQWQEQGQLVFRWAWKERVPQTKTDGGNRKKKKRISTRS